MSGGGRHERRRGRAVAAPEPDLGSGVAGLMGALDEGGAYLPPDAVASAERVLTKAGERLGLSARHTVVALAGSTGSGKSTLFNRLVGAEVSRTGQRRPTTSRAVAAVWGTQSAHELLDWVAVTDQYRVPSRSPEPDTEVTSSRGGRAGTAAKVARRYAESAELPVTRREDLDGLILLDLPDVDSTTQAHRAEADRVLALADVFVWVTDPQKYADSVLHDDYLSRARHHEAVTLVVLNQTDRMPAQDAQACCDDLRRLLSRDGLAHVEVLACSARTGEGVERVVAALTGAVAAATASRARLLGDVHAAAEHLHQHVGADEPPLQDQAGLDLVHALSRNAGVPVVARGVEADYRRRASARTGWPLTRWLRGWRPDPLARLRLDARRAPTDDGDDLGALVRRSSIPEPSSAARASLDLVTRRLGVRAGAGLPPLWAEGVATAVAVDSDLTDALDQALVGAPVQVRSPWWWSFVALMQWLLLAAGVAGLAWLTVIAALSWLGLSPVQVPSWGFVPVPTVLFVLGLVVGIAVGTVSALISAAAARRHRRRVEADLDQRIGVVVQTRIMDPVREILRRHRATREHLEKVLAS